MMQMGTAKLGIVLNRNTLADSINKQEKKMNYRDISRLRDRLGPSIPRKRLGNL